MRAVISQTRRIEVGGKWLPPASTISPVHAQYAILANPLVCPLRSIKQNKLNTHLKTPLLGVTAAALDVPAATRPATKARVSFIVAVKKLRGGVGGGVGVGEE